MKKYIAPHIEINETQAAQMMALSIQIEKADDSEALAPATDDWNIWTGDE